MNQSILRLVSMHLVKMHVEIVEPDIPVGKAVPAKHGFSIAYDVGRRTDDPSEYRMTLHVTIKPEESGWHIDSAIRAVFRCPEGLPVPQMEGLVRVNGGTILYGALRGHIAALTGAFPQMSLNLPTINMLEVVKRIEENKDVEVIIGTEQEFVVEAADG